MTESTAYSSEAQATEVTHVESAWLSSAIRALLELRKLEDDWDGSGSPPITPSAVECARALLVALEIDDPPEPQIVPVPGGGLQIEWESAERELEIEILPSGAIEYLTVEKGLVEEENHLGVDGIDDARRLVDWVCRVSR